ncbi:MAG: peptidylprolyl isomerase [Magnetococcales bacterium]|nr:peptidylprolyl isomerase [Magnetococcales bacterium]
MDRRLTAVLALFGIFCGVDLSYADNESSPTPVVAEMVQVQLFAGDMQRLLAGLEPASRAALVANRALLEKLVAEELVRKTIIQHAKTAQLDREPSVQLAMTRAADQVLLAAYMTRQTDPGPSYPSADEVRVFFDANRDRFRKPDRYHVAQIFLALPASSGKKEAMRIHRKLLENPKQFAEIARAQSQHSDSAAKGGDLGWLEEGAILPALLPVLRSLKPGEISSPVATPSGWHILRLIEADVGRQPTLSEAENAIKGLLRVDRIRRTEQELVEKMVRETPPQLRLDALKMGPEQ